MRVKRNNGEKAAARPVTGESLSHLQQLKTINLEVLGERLRRARIEKKISQRDLSNGLFTSAYLSSLELGKTRPTLSTLEQLAGLLGKSTEYFLRPTSGQNLDEALDEEQSRALELHQALLSAQVYLEHSADETVWQLLEQVSPALARLASGDQARYFYLVGRYHSRLSNFQDALGALQEAEELVGQSLADVSLNYASTEPDLAALIEYETGDVHLKTRQTMAALNRFTAGLEMLNANSNPGLRWKLLAGAATCYRLLNDPEQAQAYFQKALEQAAQNTPSVQAEYFYKRGGALSEQGDFQRSSLYYGRSIQVYEGETEHDILQKTCLSLAQLQVQAKEYAPARQVAELALKLSSSSSTGDEEANRSAELNALVLLATIYHRQNDLTGASNCLAQAQQLQEAGTGVSGGQAGSLLGQYYQVAAELKADQNDREAAEDFYQKALTTLESLQGGDDVLPARLLAEVYYSYGRRLKDWNETQKSLELMERAYRLSTGKGQGRS